MTSARTTAAGVAKHLVCAPVATAAACALVPVGQLALAGPSLCEDRGRTPMRGDLAHIRLAGRCFAPYYAVPIVYRVIRREALRRSPRVGAEVVAQIAPGRLFDALDIAGDWAWGQIVEDDDNGHVGYLGIGALVRA